MKSGLTTHFHRKFIYKVGTIVMISNFPNFPLLLSFVMRTHFVDYVRLLLIIYQFCNFVFSIMSNKIGVIVDNTSLESFN